MNASPNDDYNHKQADPKEANSKCFHFFSSIGSFLLTFVFIFGLWIIFSGKFEILLLSLGLVSSFLVSLISHRLLFPSPNFLIYLLTFIRFSRYIPWLISQILLANLHILYLVFHPKMKDFIDPHIVVFQSKLKKDFSIVTMANSITLTPGTITINCNLDGVFRVHAIDKESSKGLPGKMEDKVSKVFGEV